jgi:hypothetical protein
MQVYWWRRGESNCSGRLLISFQIVTMYNDILRLLCGFLVGKNAVRPIEYLCILCCYKGFVQLLVQLLDLKRNANEETVINDLEGLIGCLTS